MPLQAEWYTCMQRLFLSQGVSPMSETKKSTGTVVCLQASSNDSDKLKDETARLTAS